MEIIFVEKINDVHARISSTNSALLYEIEDYFSFYAPNYQFHPKYKSKFWDGKIRLFSPYKGILYIGLIPYLEQYCKDNGFDCKFNMSKSDMFKSTKITEQDVIDFFNTLSLVTNNGTKITPYNEQLKAFISCIKSGRRLILSPTASGKSLIIYLVSRWYIDKVLSKDEKILIIFPTIGLVNQMASDFAEYSGQDKSFDAERSIHKIMSGAEKDSSEQIYCSTWQSLQKMPKSYFDKFKVIICDEAHNVKADSIKKILESCTNTYGRFGFTGTLDGMKANKLTIEGLLGPVDKITDTSKLMAEGKVSDLDIVFLDLVYNQADKEHCKKYTYQEEIKFITKHKLRNKAIADLLLSRNGNSLTLLSHVSHGKYLKELVDAGNKYNKEVYFVSGSTSAEDRESIRYKLQTADNIIVIATYGVFSTGMNAPNIHHVIFGSPAKGQIRVLQSIGRGLRKHSSKTVTKLYDIVDNLQIGKRKNFAVKHALERLQIYNNEKFTFQLKTLNLG